MRQPGTWRRIWRWFRCVPVLTLFSASLLAGCGGDFEFKTSGDRPQGETRANTGQFSSASTTSHENLLSIQEQYKAKLEAEAGKK